MEGSTDMADSKFLKDIIRETTEDLREEARQNESLKEVSQNDVERVLRRGFDNIVEHLSHGDKVYLINFFNFEAKDYKEKHVKNPQTQEPMTIDPYRSVLCKPTNSAKDRLKEGMLKHPLK
jgi:nucleoid DNA-binding protein